MDVGNLVAIAFGLVGSAAGVGTAIWVYRRERKERSQEREAARKEALEAGERRQREEQEQRQVEEARHARDVRRAKHQDDYRATQAALEKLKEIAYSVRVYGLWTASKIDEIDEVRERLDRLASRLPQLEVDLLLASAHAGAIGSHLLPNDLDPSIRRAIWEGIDQVLESKETETQVDKTLAKLNKEWEA